MFLRYGNVLNTEGLGEYPAIMYNENGLVDNAENRDLLQRIIQMARDDAVAAGIHHGRARTAFSTGDSDAETAPPEHFDYSADIMGDLLPVTPMESFEAMGSSKSPSNSGRRQNLASVYSVENLDIRRTPRSDTTLPLDEGFPADETGIATRSVDKDTFYDADPANYESVSDINKIVWSEETDDFHDADYDTENDDYDMAIIRLPSYTDLLPKFGLMANFLAREIEIRVPGVRIAISPDEIEGSPHFVLGLGSSPFEDAAFVAASGFDGESVFLQDAGQESDVGLQNDSGLTLGVAGNSVKDDLQLRHVLQTIVSRLS